MKIKKKEQIRRNKNTAQVCTPEISIHFNILIPKSEIRNFKYIHTYICVIIFQEIIYTYIFVCFIHTYVFVCVK